MLESVNIFSSVAVYVQIENEVQFAIASGKLQAGDQLPPVRELSERVGVNFNTVAKAYRDLEVMGLVYTRRGMGVFIEKDVSAGCRENCLRKITGRLHEVVAEAKASGMDAKDIKDIAEACLASNAGPYGPVPNPLPSKTAKKAAKKKSS